MDEIKEGDWVCLKCPCRDQYNVPMLVIRLNKKDASVVWFSSERHLLEKVINTTFLKIYDSEAWATYG